MNEVFPISSFGGCKPFPIAFHALRTGVLQNHPESGKFCGEHLPRVWLVEADGEMVESGMEPAPDARQLFPRLLNLHALKGRGRIPARIFQRFQDQPHSIQRILEDARDRRQATSMEFI